MTKKTLKFNWNIEKVDIDKLIPYERNNKIHWEKQIDLLANIMNKFGYIDEIVVDKNNVIIAWHGRLQSIKKMWYDAVEVKKIDLDSKNASELRVLHNKIAEYDNELDLENLKIELDYIGYEELEDLDTNMKELFPEFDAPEFDPSDYEDEMEFEEDNQNKDDIKQVVISDLTKEQADQLMEDLLEQGYSDVSII